MIMLTRSSERIINPSRHTGNRIYFVHTSYINDRVHKSSPINIKYIANTYHNYMYELYVIVCIIIICYARSMQVNLSNEC